jgi:hypothetical protein
MRRSAAVFVADLAEPKRRFLKRHLCQEKLSFRFGCRRRTDAEIRGPVLFMWPL